MVDSTHTQAKQHRRRAGGDGRIARRPRPRHGRPAFTLTELMVSVGILLILLTMVGSIFSMATKASSTATANSEIMSNLRTVEQQLTRDFASLRRDAFIGLWYQLTRDPTDTSTSGTPRMLRTDRIVFFSNEAHYSVQALRDANGAIVNALAPSANQADPLGPWNARIFYGHAASIDPTAVPTETDPAKWALGRRAKLLASDIDLSQLKVSPSKAEEYDFFDFETEAPPGGSSQPLSIVDWQNHALFPIESYFETNVGGQRYPGLMVNLLTQMPSWVRRPIIDPRNNRGPHMLLLPGCAEFKIQRWVEFDPRTGAAVVPRWWPETDLNGDGSVDVNDSNDSDFAYITAGSQDLCEYFNGPPPWTTSDQTKLNIVRAAMNAGLTPFYPSSGQGQPPWLYYEPAYMPKAIKVTIRLHDANKRLDEGRLLTMVIPLQ